MLVSNISSIIHKLESEKSPKTSSTEWIPEVNGERNGECLVGAPVLGTCSAVLGIVAAAPCSGLVGGGHWKLGENPPLSSLYLQLPHWQSLASSQLEKSSI